MIIVNAAPTKIPIPSTEIAFNLFPTASANIPVLRPSHPFDHSPVVADLNINGKPPTNKLAPSMQTHCKSSIKSGMVSLNLVYSSYRSGQ